MIMIKHKKNVKTRCFNSNLMIQCRCAILMDLSVARNTLLTTLQTSDVKRIPNNLFKGTGNDSS